MNPRKIREDLGRARACVQRRDLERALYLLCLSLKDLGGQAIPTPLRGDFRNAITDICADPDFKRLAQQPVAFQPGKERELLAFFNKVYKQLKGAEEDYETALQRKLNLDHCLGNGNAYLAQGKPAEADECFLEAFKYYRNEFAVFGMIARAMLEAGHIARALGYARKGLKLKPADAALQEIVEECGRLKDQAGK